MVCYRNNSAGLRTIVGRCYCSCIFHERLQLTEPWDFVLARQKSMAAIGPAAYISRSQARYRPLLLTPSLIKFSLRSTDGSGWQSSEWLIARSPSSMHAW
ncbi:hypothetical protein MPTK1_2g22620 [Marchantia polymorpha subsp. ruderalis]|uniref:Uncharacterized protein n=1 Tax=Marchantia polymorpha TaxID=3197 RepID=A0A2R6WNA6_MARPO|nr:hypothetical protein MARPO_0072s0069 [Marchantia polymorpha]BBN03325.1 hypothetical protein Mp_2g22620 [Marchantia polymorpha subsp. ruderalis]|eukprot:PTQ35326.1 hypothetical protein MARPO_0072s0069 [Marchantia polymorpha]